MDYVEWCELVLQTMGNAADESAQIRNYGIDHDSLTKSCHPSQSLAVLLSQLCWLPRYGCD